LRIPRIGGTPIVRAYPRLDSVVWRGSAIAPPPSTMLGFDDENGSIAYADTKGRPVLLDLRLGTSTPTSDAKLDGLAAGNRSAIYGVTANGAVVRMTPTGDWTYKPTQAATSVFPQADGSVIVAAGRGS